MSASATDWIEIEGRYRAGQQSIRSIALEFSVSEALVRKKAKRNGWLRDPGGVVRERVAAAFSGAGTQKGAQSAHCAQQSMEEAVTSAIDDMSLGMRNAQIALRRISEMMPNAEEARDIKTLSESNKLNIEVIRIIRGLDKNDQTDTRTKAERDAIFAAALAGDNY